MSREEKGGLPSAFRQLGPEAWQDAGAGLSGAVPAPTGMCQWQRFLSVRVSIEKA